MDSRTDKESKVDDQGIMGRAKSFPEDAPTVLKNICTQKYHNIEPVAIHLPLPPSPQNCHSVLSKMRLTPMQSEPILELLAPR